MRGVIVIVHMGIVDDERVDDIVRVFYRRDGMEVRGLTVYRFEVGNVLLLDDNGVEISFAIFIHQTSQMESSGSV